MLYCAVLCRTVLCTRPSSNNPSSISSAPLLLPSILLTSHPLLHLHLSSLSLQNVLGKKTGEKERKGARHAHFVSAAHEGCLNNSLWAASVQEAAPPPPLCHSTRPSLVLVPFLLFPGQGGVRPWESPLQRKKKKGKRKKKIVAFLCLRPSLLPAVCQFLPPSNIPELPPPPAAANRTE